jgi:hypothetical protein
MENFINLHFVSYYLVIGAVIALITDIIIYNTKSSEQFTFSEVAACILVWPFILLRVLRQFFNNEN